ncbi:unnamed protein product, partial [Chrysoparadoxa australica]
CGALYIPLGNVEHAFASRGVYLTDQEVLLLVERFGNHRGEVHCQRLISALDLGPPPDAQMQAFIDPLPEPYRQIFEIVELCAEAAWAVIEEAHPELVPAMRLGDPEKAQIRSCLRRECGPTAACKPPGTVTQ